MNALSIILLFLVGIGLFFAIRAFFFKKKGRCSGDCSHCGLDGDCRSSHKEMK